jgi:2-amino-4-hydroxy-6-hydroxymethyldihydropteridine diphosphokinase
MTQVMHRVCLLLGSNIQPEKNIPLAVDLLRKQLTILQASSVWESKAVGSDGANILNAALLVLTSLEAEILKKQVLRPLEAQLGRVRTNDKNAPRTIDLDILFFDQQLLDQNLWQYAYRAVPMAEILPDYQSETGEHLKDAALRLARTTPIWVRDDVSLSLVVPVARRK